MARKLAEKGAPEGALVRAGEQTGGRGRLGNSFFSPPGGLYVSIVLRPPMDAGRAPLIGFAAGLALAGAVESLTGLRPMLKWPNDLLVNGRKLSGSLVDLSLDRAAVRYAILGLGVNVNTAEDVFPEHLRDTATSLRRELGHDVSLNDLLKALLSNFEDLYRGLAAGSTEPVLKAWRTAPNFLGQAVTVTASGQTFRGLAHDLDTEGALLVRLPSGETRRVIAADVHLERS